jgi:hypothetical protein
MKGTLTNGQNSTPIDFKRTGEASVELIPASPAVSKELEGDWEGPIQTPNGAVRLGFHFKNMPDNTVAATMDGGLPLNDVKQTGRKVEFGIKIGHASFEGTLNKEGAELAGQVIHEGDSGPLTLRKKQALPAWAHLG